MKHTQVHTLEELFAIGVRLGKIELLLDQILAHLDAQEAQADLTFEIDAAVESTETEPATNVVILNFGTGVEEVMRGLDAATD